MYTIAVFLIGNSKDFVDGRSSFVVPIGEFDFQSTRKITGEPMKIFIADPEVGLIVNIAETTAIIEPWSIEINEITLTILYD